MENCGQLSLFQNDSEETIKIPIIGSVDSKTGRITFFNQQKMGKIIKVKSFTTEGKFYDVDLGRKMCSCPAFSKRGGKAMCKHLRKLLRIDEESGPSLSLLKSALQKAIRRNDVGRAVRCAKALMEKNIIDFLRRLAVIVLEDVILHPDYDKLIEILKSISSIKKSPNESEQDFLINLVADLAKTEWRDDFVHIIKFNSLTGKEEGEIGEKEFNLIRAIKYRAVIGGMGGDVMMLEKYAKIWEKRFKNGLTVEDLKKYFQFHTEFKYKDIKEITENDILKEAVDFHCSPLLPILLRKPYMLNLIKSEFGDEEKSVEDRLKDIIWRMRSGISGKIQIGENRPMDLFKDYPHIQFKEGEEEKERRVFSKIKDDIDRISVWFILKQFGK